MWPLTFWLPVDEFLVCLHSQEVDRKLCLDKCNLGPLVCAAPEPWVQGEDNQLLADRQELEAAAVR